jgi:threonine/homoserine/homoserine lactone efflux protein
MIGGAMPDLAQWSVFLTASIILLVIPGPSVLFVVARGIDRGFRAAVFSSVGLAVGDMFQLLCAAVGLSTLLASSIALFTTVKYAGAAYLIFLGLQRILEKDTAAIEDSPSSSPAERSRHTLIVQGFSVNALNPKTTLFFLALLPQFVNPGRGPAWLQILVLGAAFVVLGLMTNTIYGRMGETRFACKAKRPLSQGDTLCGRGNTSGSGGDGCIGAGIPWSRPCDGVNFMDFLSFPISLGLAT